MLTLLNEFEDFKKEALTYINLNPVSETNKIESNLTVNLNGNIAFFFKISARHDMRISFGE